MAVRADELLIFTACKTMNTVSACFRFYPLTILIYHQVLAKPDPLRDEIDVVAFDQQMRLLSKYFNVLPLGEAVRLMHNDSLPPRCVAISFDDGYADNYERALPVLEKYGLSATFFIATGFLNGGRMWNDTVIETIRLVEGPSLDLRHLGLGVFSTASMTDRSRTAKSLLVSLKHRPYDERRHLVDAIAAPYKDQLPNNLMMTSEQVVKLDEAGMEIGAHTVSHPILQRVNESTARREISQGKDYLEELLGKKIRAFAYPNGKPFHDYDYRHVVMVRDLEFDYAVSTAWGAVTQTSERFQLPRFTPWSRQPAKFVLQLLLNYSRRQYPVTSQSQA